MHEEKSIDELIPNPKNPRTISPHDYEALRQTILSFGNLEGIVLNLTTGHLVGGHQRVRIFKREGGQPVITERYEQPTSKGTVAIGYVILGDEKFSYREVQWAEGWEKAANIAANRAR